MQNTQNTLLKRTFFSDLILSKTIAQRIAYIAVMTAFSVVTNMFLEFRMFDIQFSITIVVSALSGILLGPLCGFAACNGCGAVLGCGRLCGGRLRDRASGREISSVGCAFAARAVSFSDGGGLLLMGDSRISAGASGRRGAVSCLGRHFA